MIRSRNEILYRRSGETKISDDDEHLTGKYKCMRFFRQLFEACKRCGRMQVETNEQQVNHKEATNTFSDI